MEPLERVVAYVRDARPDLVDAWEVTALIESAGYSDRRIREELGFADARALALVVLHRLRGEPASASPEPMPPGSMAPRTRSGVLAALQTFASDVTGSAVYAVPWLVLFWVQHVRPDAFAIPELLAAPLMLALMASLIVTAGFVQAIARKGVFYVSMEQRVVAHHVTGRLFECGALVAAATAVLGSATASHFDLLPLPALVLVTLDYVALCLLWLTCALITIDGRRWRVPMVFAGGAAAFAACRALHLAALASQLAATYVALLAGALLAALDRARHADRVPALPNTRVLLHSLAPYFWYGTLYFAMLFADRLVAGGVRLLRGERFGLSPAYAHATDVALVSFLVMAALVEYMNGSFMRDLVRRLASTPAGDPRLAREVSRRHLLYVAVIVVAFPMVGAACRTLSLALRPLAADGEGWQVLMMTSTGYLLLSAALFNSLILLSLNRAFAVVSSFALAVAVDLAVGIVLALALGAAYAAGGLMIGTAVLAVRTTAKVGDALSAPAHAYCAA